MTVVSSNHMKCAWEAGFGGELTDEVWSEGMEQIHLSSINARLQLIQFKVMYYSKEKMKKCILSDIFDRFNLSKGTLGHIFCFCPKIVLF